MVLLSAWRSGRSPAAHRQSDGIRHWDTGPEIVAVGSEPILQRGPFRQVFVLPAAVANTDATPDTTPDTPARHLIETLRESRFGAFCTRVMTTAAPVSAARLDLCESEEIAALALDNLARREQS